MARAVCPLRSLWSRVALGLLALALVAFSPACQAGAKSQAGFPTYQWEPIGLSGGGGMFSPAISPVDPDLMMINCDMSGAYLTHDGGRHWTMIHHQQLQSNTRCRPGFHPRDAKVIYASDGGTGRLKVSRDGGEHWSFSGDFYPSSVVAFDPDNPLVMFAGSGGGIAISRDGGGHWTNCAGPAGRTLGFAADRTSPKTARVFFAATNQGVWRSDDGGTTWTARTAGLPAAEITSFMGGSNKGSGLTMLYCTVPSVSQNGTFTGGVFRSRDRGEHWEWAMGNGINKELQRYDEWADGEIAHYPFVLTTDTRPLTVYAFNTSTGFWPPHNPGVYRSEDGGDNWRRTMFLDPRFPEFNCGYDWVSATQHRADQGGAFGAAIANSDPERVMRLENLCFITVNGGRTWEPAHTIMAQGQKPEPNSAWLCNGLVVTTTWHYYVDPFQRNRHYICYTDLGFARSLDAGKTWSWWAQEGRAPWGNTTYELAFDPQTPGKMWGAFSNLHDIPNYNIIGGAHGSQAPGGVALSTDYGATWAPVKSGLPNKACTSIVLDPRSRRGARTLYAAFFDDGVYRSTDDGKTWAKRSEGLGAPQNTRVYRLILHKDGTLFALITAKRANRAFLQEGVGLYRSRDGGGSWQRISAGIESLWFKDFAVDPKSSKVIFVGAANTGGENGGLYRTADGGETWKRVLKEGNEHFGAYFHPARPGWVYATLTEGCPGPSLWLSTDGGETWKALENFPFDNAQRVEFDPADPDTICVTTFGGSIWRGRAG